MKGTQGAPVLLNELIFMVLPSSQIDNLYAGQSNIQLGLVIIAFLCFPVMMFAKPCCLWRDHKNKTKHTIVHHTDDEESEVEPILTEDHGGGGHGHEEFQFSEIMVHQALETIEFVLGSVSHTASYLRLWALSLAHSELATVFWMKVMSLLITMAPTWNDETTGGAHAPAQEGLSFIVTAFFVFFGQSIWFFVTLLVMMFMEGLSAFLHALRLHWVEFQSKFYKGDGHQFQPFSFARINEDEFI